ncbi:MAG: tRNA preQ1(34) S-adenosylmethionine ribosyltransferase-isomerase QueA [Acidaminobacteraceae bacterium]
MNKADFYFDLPDELIAQVPLKDRTSSKLMHLDKKTGEIKHEVFKDVIDHLGEGDLLVLNDTRVLPARIYGKKDTGATVEFLLLKRDEDDNWISLVKPGRKAKPGAKFVFGDGLMTCEVLSIEDEGARKLKFTYDGVFEEILDKVGMMPLPPYITEKLEDQERYQTVYSKYIGSAAAPTAGLHFTDELLAKIKEKKIDVAFVTLHVGLGTFRPVKVDSILDHKMHSEYYDMSKETALMINNAKSNGKKVVSVGTTSTRTIESCARKKGVVKAGSGWTEIFIYPGCEFKIIDGLITNFHLPESTLIMLVSALSTRENVLNAYQVAVENKYRFFSFGDAMIII